MVQKFPSLLATTNTDKRNEWNQILRLLAGAEAPVIEALDQRISLLEIQSMDPTAIAVVKAADACRRLGKYVLVEDVSFSMNGLNGFPGPLYAPVENALGRERIHRFLEGNSDRSATATITIAFVDRYDRNTVRVVRVDQPGTVPEDISGINGFGWDPLFIPQGQTKTFAQMTQDEKNGCSMRRIAIDALMRGAWESYPVSHSPIGHYLG